ncbi:hypothetical protein TGCAST_268990 [Toxoplasma gondii CAST]|uniref:Uncharacterized protein n=2 Tax=Toxoplasma gondii TaxID=5811 RepID=A0A3R7YX55_TOXGO|nr:hypothetical protein TGCAST_268990 [Toxoplasma gondii CAST]
MAATLGLQVPQTLPAALTKLLSVSSPDDAEAAFNAATEWLALPAACGGNPPAAPTLSPRSATHRSALGLSASSSPRRKTHEGEEVSASEETRDEELDNDGSLSARGKSILATRVYLLYDFLLQHVETSPALASVACDILSCLLEASSVVLWEIQREVPTLRDDETRQRQSRASDACLSSLSASSSPHSPGKVDPFLLLLSCASSAVHRDTLKAAMSSAPHCFYPPPGLPNLLGVTIPLPLPPESRFLPPCSSSCSACSLAATPCPSPSAAGAPCSCSASRSRSTSCSPRAHSPGVCLPILALCSALCRSAKPKELFVGLSGCLASSVHILPALRLLLLPSLAACCGATGRRRTQFVVQAASLVLHATVKKASRARHLGLHRLASPGAAATGGASSWELDELHAPCAWAQTFRRLYPPAARDFVFPEADSEDEAEETAKWGLEIKSSPAPSSPGSQRLTDADTETERAERESEEREREGSEPLLSARAPMPAHVTLCGLVAFVRCLCVSLAAAEQRERTDETQRRIDEEPTDPRGVGPLTILAATLRVLELFTPMLPDIQFVEFRKHTSSLSPCSSSLHSRAPHSSDVDGWAAAMQANRDAFYDARNRVWQCGSSCESSSRASSSPASSRSSRCLVSPLPSLLSCLQSLVWCGAFLHERYRGGLLPSLTGLLNTTAIPSPNQGDLEVSPFSLAFFSYLLLALRLGGSAAMPSPISQLSRATMAFRASFLLLSYANPHASASLAVCRKGNTNGTVVAKGSEKEHPQEPIDESTRFAALAAVQTAGLPERHTWLVERKAEQLCLLGTDFLSFGKQHERSNRFLSLCAGFSPFAYWKLLLALLTSGGTAASTVLLSQPLGVGRKSAKGRRREQRAEGEEDEADGSRATCLSALSDRRSVAEPGQRDPEDVQLLFECFSQASQVYDLATQEDLFLSLIRKPPPLPDAAVGAILILLKRRWTASVLHLSCSDKMEGEAKKTGGAGQESGAGNRCVHEAQEKSISTTSHLYNEPKKSQQEVDENASFSPVSPSPSAWVACLDSPTQTENAEMLWRVMVTTLVDEAEGTVVENSERLTTALNWLKLCLYTPEKATPASPFKGPFEQFGDAVLARGQRALERALEKLTTRVDIELSILLSRQNGVDSSQQTKPLSCETSEPQNRQSLLSVAAKMPSTNGSPLDAGVDQLELLVPAGRGSGVSQEGENAAQTRKASVEENLKLALVQVVLGEVRCALQARAERMRQAREDAKESEGKGKK